MYDLRIASNPDQLPLQPKVLYRAVPALAAWCSAQCASDRHSGNEAGNRGTELKLWVQDDPGRWQTHEDYYGRLHIINITIVHHHSAKHGQCEFSRLTCLLDIKRSSGWQTTCVPVLLFVAVFLLLRRSHTLTPWISRICSVEHRFSFRKVSSPKLSKVADWQGGVTNYSNECRFKPKQRISKPSPKSSKATNCWIKWMNLRQSWRHGDPSLKLRFRAEKWAFRTLSLWYLHRYRSPLAKPKDILAGHSMWRKPQT